MTMQEIVLFLTAVYTVIQIFILVRDKIVRIANEAHRQRIQSLADVLRAGDDACSGCAGVWAELPADLRESLDSATVATSRLGF